MKKIIEKLDRISLKEELEAEGLSESLIETLMDVAEDNIDTAIICNNEAELHAAIESMSIVEEDEK